MQPDQAPDQGLHLVEDHQEDLQKALREVHQEEKEVN